MLVVVVHTVDEVSATLPLSMIVLLEHAKRKSVPPDMSIRHVLPTSGTCSVSVWECADPEGVRSWCDENLGVDCKNDVLAVQEDFVFGMTAEMEARARARVAGVLATGGKQAIAAVSSGATKAARRMEEGLESIEARTGVAASLKRSTSAAASRVKQVVGAPRVQQAADKMQAGLQRGFQRAGFAMSWIGERINKLTDTAIDRINSARDGDSPHEYSAQQGRAAAAAGSDGSSQMQGGLLGGDGGNDRRSEEEFDDIIAVKAPPAGGPPAPLSAPAAPSAAVPAAALEVTAAAAAPGAAPAAGVIGSPRKTSGLQQAATAAKPASTGAAPAAKPPVPPPAPAAVADGDDDEDDDDEDEEEEEGEEGGNASSPARAAGAPLSPESRSYTLDS